MRASRNLGSFAKSTRQLRSPPPGSGRRVYHQSLTHPLATVEEGVAMKRITVILFILAFALATTGLAMADAFTFNFSGNGQTGSGRLVGPPEVAGQWSITGASGTIDTFAITGIAPCTYPGTCTIATTTWDNILYYPAVVTFPNTGAANLDWNGLMFTLANGDYLNLYYYDNQSQGADICGGLGYCASLI